MALLTKVFKLLCSFCVIFVGVLLGPSVLPDSAKFTPFSVAPVKYLGEGLRDNNLLDNAERLFENEVKGPEAFEIVNGELYTTLHGGFVAKVFDDQIIPVVKFGEPCEGWWEEIKCGRPLGIKAHGNHYLFVADSYYGIFKYNIKNRKSVNLVDKDIIIDGKKAKIFNGVEVAKDGSVFWTHSSSDFNIEDGIYAFLADGSGRLLMYDPTTQKNIVLLDDLHFANGLILSPEEDYLLISETGLSRILKFYLKGPKKFTKEIFIDGLPGMPDNLRRNKDIGYIIPLVVARDESHPAAFQVIAPFPIIRKFLVRFLCLIEFSLGKIQKIYPNYFIKRALHYVGHLESVSMLLPLKTTILEVDLNGNVIKSYHGSDGSVTSVSDVIAHNEYLWFGSPTNNYLARIKLSKLNKSPLEKASGQLTQADTTVEHTITTSTPVIDGRPQKSSTTATEVPQFATTTSTKHAPPPSTVKSSTAIPPNPSTSTESHQPKITTENPFQPPNEENKVRKPQPNPKH